MKRVGLEFIAQFGWETVIAQVLHLIKLIIKSVLTDINKIS